MLIELKSIYKDKQDGKLKADVLVDEEIVSVEDGTTFKGLKVKEIYKGIFQTICLTDLAKNKDIYTSKKETLVYQ